MADVREGSHDRLVMEKALTGRKLHNGVGDSSDF